MTKLERRLRPRERWRSERRQRLHDIWGDVRWWLILAGARLLSGITDAGGAPLAPVTWSFTTGP